MKSSTHTGMKSAFDRTMLSLCTEIDRLTDEVEYWKDRYETEVNERNEEWKERHEKTQRDLANTLLFALSTTDDADGNLVIKREDRKNIIENWQ